MVLAVAGLMLLALPKTFKVPKREVFDYEGLARSLSTRPLHIGPLITLLEAGRHPISALVSCPLSTGSYGALSQQSVTVRANSRRRNILWFGTEGDTPNKGRTEE